MENWLKNNWTHPVWSKVFGGLILELLIGLFSFIISLIKQIPFIEFYHYSLSNYIQINYFVLANILVLIFTFIFMPLLLKKYRWKQDSTKSENEQTPFDFSEIFPGRWTNAYTLKGQKPLV